MAADPPLIGRTLSGRFTLTGKLGEGGFSTVYRGVQVEGFDPRDVAVKVMNPELARDRQFVRRFRREAHAALRVNHPSCVRLLEYAVDGGCVFIVMELLAGVDLFEVLAREGRLSPIRAVRLLMQVCEALDAAHAQGVIHRDLKPENIMLVPDLDVPGGERVKVLDFGVAKILDPGLGARKVRPSDLDDGTPSSAHSVLTRAGTVMGTPAYMSPEQGRAETIDARTDLYACGILLYQLVTGRVPFDGETALQIVMQHVHNEPTPPTEWVPELPAALESLILKCLSKWPADRQQSALDLRAELAALLPSLAADRGAPRETELLAPRTPLRSDGGPGSERPSTIVDDAPLEITTVDMGDDDGDATLVRDPGPPRGGSLPPARRRLVSTPTPLLSKLEVSLDERSPPSDVDAVAMPTPPTVLRAAPPSAGLTHSVAAVSGPPVAEPRSASATAPPSMGVVSVPVTHADRSIGRAGAASGPAPRRVRVAGLISLASPATASPPGDPVAAVATSHEPRDAAESEVAADAATEGDVASEGGAGEDAAERDPDARRSAEQDDTALELPPELPARISAPPPELPARISAPPPELPARISAPPPRSIPPTMGGDPREGRASSAPLAPGGPDPRVYPVFEQERSERTRATPVPEPPSPRTTRPPSGLIPPDSPAPSVRFARMAPAVAMAIGIAIGALGCGVIVVIAVLLTR